MLQQLRTHSLSARPIHTSRIHHLRPGILLFLGLQQIKATDHSRLPPRGMATANSEGIVIHVSAPDKKTATMISSQLVEKKLAACVQTIPGIESTYVWEGKVETETELLLLIKTQQAHLESIINVVQSLHPYDVPEVIATPVNGGCSKYIEWLKDTTTKT